MMIRYRRTRPVLLVASCLLVATATVPAQGIPARLSDSEFWQLVNTTSEPGGYFRSDNFISNEMSYQQVIPALRESLGTGGIYIGVGPEQNFTYISALEPRMAFIVDIRRQNMLQHLMYKALFELSSDRAEFLSRLFARAKPAGLGNRASAAHLMAAFDAQPSDSALYHRNLAAIRQKLVADHGFTLSEDDLTSMAYVYTSFVAAGPGITYSFGNASQRRTRFMPTFAQLMAETDTAGTSWSFLSSERAWNVVRDLHRKNLIVPVVGDFGGPKALRAVGDYLRQRGAVVSAFYTSNVEQYLFQQDGVWQSFFANVATLPSDSNTTFIRAVFGAMRPPVVTWPADSTGIPVNYPTMRSATQLSSLQEVVRAAQDGRILSYFDLTTGRWQP
jgi:hypothetical protein